MAFIDESEIEAALLEQLAALGYACATDDEIGPDGKKPERAANDEVVLQGRLRAAVARLNPNLPEEAREDAIRKVLQSELPSLIEENRRIHRLLSEGVAVEYYADDGTIAFANVALADFERVEANDWLAVSQMTVISGQHQRRPDVVVYLNGLPIAVIELKAPGNDAATLAGAFNQLQTYKNEIAQLFRTNAVLVTSDGLGARVGSLSADLERFMPWRTTTGTTVAPKGEPELSVMIEGVFEKSRLLSLILDFTVFCPGDGGIVKIVAGYHQFHAVKKAVASTIRAMTPWTGTREDPGSYGLPSVAMQPKGDKKAGVIWHTQGSGKSYLMAFYAGQLVRHPEMRNPTIVVLTDRNDLDDQLFTTFSKCRDLLRQTPVQVQDREDLRTQLRRASGGVVFTTLQKFSEGAGLLSDRSNVVVMADEAHRSQYGFNAKVDQAGAVSYGFAKYLRDALPNASFIGFTGTPIEADDVNTPAVFGNYIDVYDISRAVEDGATVPIYYESRLARIELDEREKPLIDDEVEALTEDDPEAEQERLKRKWSTIEALVGSDKRVQLIAKDIVAHFEARTAALEGKAMIVCMSRRICVKLYDEIVKLRPDWHSDDPKAGAIKVVMTGSASDPPEWQKHVGNGKSRDELAKRARDASDPLKLVIVRDMWLTGFDAPSMHTMYVDKPMRGHGLMQAIARVNRVFRDKPSGLIVDYIGVAQNLKSALAQYSPRDRERTGIDESEAIAVLQEKYEGVSGMFHGFVASGVLRETATNGTAQTRLSLMARAIEWILERQQRWAEKETAKDGKKAAHRRYQDAVLALSKAFALASASDLARAIREEVGFFQAVRAALVKSSASGGTSKQERDFAIQQIVSRAVVSTEIVDILRVTGIKAPDISIFSEAFLSEVQQMESKNLALEALRKLLNDGIRSRSKANIVESRAFSERLEDAIARYHANAITTAEMLQELIGLAKDIMAARKRGEESGLSSEEVAFYTALAENKSALEVMGDEKLRVIAHELLVSLKQNVSVDWAHRESARARMRVLVKRILRKYGYPPDLQDAAVKTVLAQAEALYADIAQT
jgi:type I restriction enzyme, R subunit